MAVTPNPLRTQARILRLWIKPWEDADGDLDHLGYVYVQVDNGQWQIDHVQRQIRDLYAPLKPPPKPVAETTAESGASTSSPLPMLQRPPLSVSGTSPAQ